MRVDRAKRVALKDMMELDVKIHLLKEFNDRRLELSKRRSSYDYSKSDRNH